MNNQFVEKENQSFRRIVMDSGNLKGKVWLSTGQTKTKQCLVLNVNALPSNSTSREYIARKEETSILVV